MNGYSEEKQGILQTHLILLKNFYVRKQLSQIKHVNLYKELRYFIHAIIYHKKIHIRGYSYTVQKFFNIYNNEVEELKKIDLPFIDKIINQNTYRDSIYFIQNYPEEIRKIEMIITNVFPKVFKRLLC